jgi:hypothetical protein
LLNNIRDDVALEAGEIDGAGGQDVGGVRIVAQSSEYVLQGDSRRAGRTGAFRSTGKRL